MRLNSIVPNFKCDSTKGPIQFYDWLGDSWCILFSHPADFTPVCTTELGRIALHQPEFIKRNVKLLAHSVDQLQRHIDWVNDIKMYCSDIPGEFPYPIIADPGRKLAVLLDMIDEIQNEVPEIAETVRSLYVISPDHRLRLSLQYPVSTGRNVDEMIRVIDSLQLVDRLQIIATPANWTPINEYFLVNSQVTKVMILPHVADEEIKKVLPNAKIDTVRMPSGIIYLRTTEDY